MKLISLTNSQMWTYGPQWLRNNHDCDINGNNSKTVQSASEVDVSNESNDCSIQMQLNFAERVSSILPFERWGDLSKAIRICASFLEELKEQKERNRRIEQG